MVLRFYLVAQYPQRLRKMGWLKLGARARATTLQEDPKSTSTIQHTETVMPGSYPYAHSSIPDSELPFIEANEVSKRTSAATGGLCVLYIANLFGPY